MGLAEDEDAGCDNVADVEGEKVNESAVEKAPLNDKADGVEKGGRNSADDNCEGNPPKGSPASVGPGKAGCEVVAPIAAKEDGDGRSEAESGGEGRSLLLGLGCGLDGGPPL